MSIFQVQNGWPPSQSLHRTHDPPKNLWTKQATPLVINDDRSLHLSWINVWLFPIFVFEPLCCKLACTSILFTCLFYFWTIQLPSYQIWYWKCCNRALNHIFVILAHLWIVFWPLSWKQACLLIFLIFHTTYEGFS